MNHARQTVFVLLLVLLCRGYVLADDRVNTATLPLGNGSMVAYWSKKSESPTPPHLLIHFHGSPDVVLKALDRSELNAVLVVVNFPGLSSAYSKPFASDDELFEKLLSGVLLPLPRSDADGEHVHWQSVTVSSFSAGYGAVREILKSPKYFERIDSIVAADSIYAGLKKNHPVRAVDEQNMKDFLRFASLAAERRKTFVLSHSSQQTPYASTTETADYLLQSLNIDREPMSDNATPTLQQTSVATCERLFVQGFAGETGKDHMQHLHNIDLLWKQAFLRAEEQSRESSATLRP